MVSRRGNKQIVVLQITGCISSGVEKRNETLVVGPDMHHMVYIRLIDLRPRLILQAAESI